MSRSVQQEIRESDLHGFKHSNPLLPVMKELRDAGWARDRPGDRILHDDPSVALILLYSFNPIVTSP